MCYKNMVVQEKHLNKQPKQVVNTLKSLSASNWYLVSDPTEEFEWNLPLYELL